MTLPMDIYPALMRAIDLIGQGKTKTAACDEAGIAYSQLTQYCENTPELRSLYEDAEQRGYDIMADNLVNIDQFGAMLGVSDPKMLAILSKNIQWYLSRRRPRQYGERVSVEHNITADRAIIEALHRGKERAASALLEDVTYSVVKETLRLPDGGTINLDDVDPDLLALV